MSLNGDRLPPQANPLGEQLGLGAAFTPTAPVSWRLIAGTLGTERALFLIFDTPTGRTCITLDPTGALHLSDKLREQAGGLTIPRLAT